jgi:hypothetical protein
MSELKYVAKFPVKAEVRPDMLSPFIPSNKKAYGYLAFTDEGHLKFTFNYNDGKSHTHIRLIPAKGYLFETMMYHLMVRPIQRKKSQMDNFWVNKRFFTAGVEMPIEEVDPKLLFEYYENVKSQLKESMKIELDEDDRRLMEDQYYRLLNRFSYITAFNEIVGAKFMVKKVA